MTRLASVLAAVATAGLSMAGAVQAQDAAASLKLAFETRAPTGAVMVSLYDSEAAYAGGRPVASARIDIAAGQTEAAFANLMAGEYAVKAFHDLNGDGRMNTNPFGMPVEPYAFSNNAVGNMGPASWERARFAVSGAASHSIRID